MTLQTAVDSKATDLTPATGRKGEPDDSYKIQLDGVRAIAVIGVIIEHYIPVTEWYIGLGDTGVRLFFVLSGFLITGILLQARHKAARSGETRRWVIFAFYVRRFLRIFPIFYAVIIVTALLGSRPMLETYRWHVVYLSNIFLFRVGTGYDSVGHLWSLAVEEQFYLVWPCLMLFLPERLLKPTMIAAIITGPLVRTAVLLTGHNEWQSTMLMPACLDTLATGGLLAILSTQVPVAVRQMWTRIGAAIGFPLLVFISFGRHLWPTDYWAVPFDLSIALIAAWLVHGAAVGFSGIGGRLLSTRAMVHIGMISYGIYLIHPFVPGLVARLIYHTTTRPPLTVGWLAMLCIATLAITTASWFFFEAPINRLKRHFHYVRRKPMAVGNG